MKRILSLNTRDLATSKKEGGCGECQTSCQSACKTSCGVAHQKCAQSAKCRGFSHPYDGCIRPVCGRIFLSPRPRRQTADTD